MTVIKISDFLFAAKERYGRDVTDIMNREPLLLRKIKKATDVHWDGEGRYFVRPLRLEGGQSQGFYAEAEILPPSEPSVGDRMLIYFKSMAFTIQITRQNIIAIKQNAGAFFNAKANEVEQNTISLREKMSRAMAGDGMGVLGILAGAAVVAGGDSTLTFTDATNMQYFRKGACLDLWRPAYPVVTRTRISDMAGGSAAADNVSFDKGWRILEVNRAARTVKVDGDMNAGGGAQNPAAGDYALPMNEGIGLNGVAAGSNLDTGKEIAGLQYLFSTGQYWPRLQALSYATYPEIQSPRDTAGAPRPLTPIMLEKMKDDIQIASGMGIDFIYFDHFQNRQLLAAGLQDVRHVSEKVALGYTEFSWNGKSFFVDRLAPPGKALLCSLDALGRVEAEDLGPMDGPQGERISRYAVQEWAYGADMNLFVRKPNAGGWIENLTTS